MTGDLHRREPIRVVVVAQVRLVSEGLASVLSKHERLDIVAAVTHGNEAAITCARLRPDIALLDSHAAAACAAVRELAGAASTKLVALAVPDDNVLLACTESGVSGFVPADASLDVLVETLEQTRRGELNCCPRVAGLMAQRLAALAEARERPHASRGLTARQAQIARLIGEGLSNKEIASQLSIELPTVKNHVHNILEKLELCSRTEVAVRATHGRVGS